MSSVEAGIASASYFSTLLEEIVEAESSLALGQGQTICFNDAISSAIYFIVAGQVKITAVSGSGKEAVLALLGPQEFFSEGGIIGRSSTLRMATGLVSSRLLRIDKRLMFRAIEDHPDLRQQLINALLRRNIAIEEDLCDQFFNQSAKRLARALLKLARSEEQNVGRDIDVPAVDHATLAKLVGTSRSYITRMMIQFRRVGLIDYQGYLHDHPRLTVRTGPLTARLLDGCLPSPPC
jgi:CRP/FNR family transcriptional regulator, cyclic AMP receptor protein